MAINKAMQAALKALSYSEFDVKKNYKAQRTLEDLKGRRSSPGTKRALYESWDCDVIYEDRKVPVRIFTPKCITKPQVLLFFHGGGWVAGNIDNYDGVCQDMAYLTGCVVVSVDYRLSPEHKFPAALEDCYAVARELVRDGALIGGTDKNLCLIGDSAGGNLAAAVSLKARDQGEFLPGKQILIYPSAYNNHSEQSPYPSVRENGRDYLLTSKRVQDYMDLYCARDEDRQSPYFAPLLADSFASQPDTLIISAQYCPLRDEGEDYGRRLLAAGNYVRIFRMKDALHGYFRLPLRFVHVKRTYELMNWFLKEEAISSVQ